MSNDPNTNPDDLLPKPMKGKYDGRKNNGATKARKCHSADLPAKSMKGKYDKRKNNGSTRERRRTNPNLGPKPKWMKHISRNAAYMILRQFDDIASFAQIYAWCWEHKKVELMVGMREYVWNRLEGRPFVAENPAVQQKAQTLLQDNRLQFAIKQLILPNMRQPRVLNSSQPPVIDAQPAAESEQQPAVDAQSQKNGNGQADEMSESTKKEIARLNELMRIKSTGF